MGKTSVASTVGSLFGYVLGCLLCALAFKLGVEFWTAQLGHFRHVTIFVALLAGLIVPIKPLYAASAFTLCYWLLT